jgi:hypothetical protein
MTRAEALEALACAIDRRAREVYGGEGDESSDRSASKDLMRALARMLTGQSLRAAFGSPGEWGYGTAIGKALADFYAAPDAGERPGFEAPR